VRANVYVDGFNLYYGAVKGTQYKWLDIAALSRLLLPSDAINRIRYVTARIQSDPRDPDKPTRQQLYLRALGTIPNLTIHFGHYLESRPRMPLANPQSGQPRTVQVIKTEEKGSDVNLSTFMLLDAFDKDYELAVLISNDSDLLLPVEVVRNRLALTVGVLNPHPKNPSVVLQRAAHFFRPIRQGPVSASRFPATLTDAQGTFTKPPGW
jgi:NYN domain